MLIHQMRISTNQVSSVVLRPNTLGIQTKFLQTRLMSEILKFYGRYKDSKQIYKLSLTWVLSAIFHSDSEDVFGPLTLTADNYTYNVHVHDLQTG
jgi:hypothetical protein